MLTVQIGFITKIPKEENNTFKLSLEDLNKNGI